MKRLCLFNILCLGLLVISCDKKEPVTPDNPTPVDPVPQVVKVTGVKLDKTAAELKIGETVQLSATVEPSNATEKSISWKTDDSSIADVDGKGLVTALKGGTTTISVITKDGNFVDKCSISIKEPLSLKIYFDRNEVPASISYRLRSRPEDRLEFKLFDTKVNNYINVDGLEVVSSSDKVAIVSGLENGSCFVKAVEEGTATLTFSSKGEVISVVTLTVLPKPEYGVYLGSPADENELLEGSTLRLNPSNRTTYLILYDKTNKVYLRGSDAGVSCEASDSKIASVSAFAADRDTAWIVSGHGVGNSLLSLKYGEFNRTLNVRVTDYTIYIDGVEVKYNYTYDMGTNPNNIIKVGIFDKSAKKFVDPSTLKIVILAGSNLEILSLTETERQLRFNKAGMSVLEFLDTSDGKDYYLLTLMMTAKGGN